jgi:hypothetical protein
MLFSLHDQIAQNGNEECEEDDEGNDREDLDPDYGFHVVFYKL